MLGVSNESVIESQWASLESQALLPNSPEEFFSYAGPMPNQYACMRAYERHYMRCKAILQQECNKHAIYIKDCSRTGMGLISPVQLFPCQRVQLWMDSTRSYQVEIRRCRKLGDHCYECGTEFILG